MARVADHLSVEDLEAGFRSAQDPTATRHFQVIWLLARGHTDSGRWSRAEDSWVVGKRVGWCAMSRGGEAWRGLLLI
jgi:hypothetical protein